MESTLKRRSLLLAMAGLCAGAARRAAGEPPDPAVKTIRAFYDALLSVMKQAQQLGVRGRYDKLDAPVRAAFDLPLMTRIAVGPAWTSMAGDEQTALVDAFTRMTIATYASRFDGYSGERFDVEAQSEPRASGRIVHSKLLPASGEAVVLNYLLRDSGAGWKIVDVYLTGTISELATRRAEFATILKTGGARALIDSLQQKTAAMLRA